MNVPQPESYQHGIVVQVRVGKHSTSDAWLHVVPPMSPVFKQTKPRATKRQRTNDEVQSVTSGHTNGEFVGVSMGGLADGAACHKFREAQNRLSVITRGMATVMCDYEKVKNIPLMTPVCFVPRPNTKTGFIKFHAKTPFWDLAAAAGKPAIGILVGKPTDRHRSNDARVLLY